MERLTRVIKDGPINVLTICQARHGDAAVWKEWSVSKDNAIKEALLRLATYEDLNLSPAEIAEKLKELAELQSKIISKIHKSLDWADKLRAKTINYTELAINNGLALGKIAVLLNHEYADNPPKEAQP